jgi:hypothetical protein
MYRRNPILIEMADGDYSEYRTALITGIRYYENGCADYFLTDGDIGITDEYDVYYKSPVFLNSDQANKRTGFLYYSDWDNKAYTNWVSTASCEIDRDED